MKLLHPLADFGVLRQVAPAASPCYWYTGTCPASGAQLRLPRTAEVEAIARGLMAQFDADPNHPQEGKMYGVLLVKTPGGDWGVLKAFSGLLPYCQQQGGWVPAIPGRNQVALAEAETLAQLGHIRDRLRSLQQLPERLIYAQQADHYAQRLQTLAHEHRLRKQRRAHQREQYQTTLTGEVLETALNDLIRQSQRDGGERRRLKGEREQVLSPLAAAIAQADQQQRLLKQQRRQLSHQLQAQMHAVYSLTNFAGVSAPLETLLPHGLPTGTGDCAAPKLLNYAAQHHLEPLAMAEFWWGAPRSDKQPGQFYGACAERCQPIMGFLLSGLPEAPVPADLSAPIPIVYRDEHLIIVDKPTGLLSVPGRTPELQDSVLSRLQCHPTMPPYLKAVHRLDKGTSGLFMLAASPTVHRQMNQQFAQRQVSKTYEAILSKSITAPTGTIALPLWRNPRDRPKQSVNWTYGKPSLTTFRLINRQPNPRVQFSPKTGRTHQLRVHAAHPNGLDAPILGDTLYGCNTPSKRLHLHASALNFIHPVTQKRIKLFSSCPF